MIDAICTFVISVVALRTIVAYAALWYVKEYRFDRMIIHLKTPQGRTVLFPSFRRPPVSPKSLVLVGSLVLVYILSLGVIPISLMMFRALIGYFMLFPISWGIVGGTTIPTILLHAFRIKKAVSLLRAHKKMIVIGITGSYGKTSTKEFLYTILASKYRVLKTQASRNSPIGIAETILSDLRDDHEMFIVEMGAYRPGEIRTMCEMVRPDIGIVTAVNAQHQDLFKTIETTMSAKGELWASLSGKKIAIANTDNEFVRLMTRKIQKDTHLWAYHDVQRDMMSPPPQADFTYAKVKAELQKLAFTIQTKEGQKVLVQAPIQGAHFAANLTGAIAAAVAAGMSLADAAKAAASCQNVEKVLAISKGPGDSVLINDTFNNNPDAAEAAIRYLSQFQKKKILVFQPMIELGNYSYDSHVRVGTVASDVCDEIILTNTNFYEGFAKGVATRKTPPSFHVSQDPQTTANMLKKQLASGDAVLFKGKEAETIFRLIAAKKI